MILLSFHSCCVAVVVVAVKISSVAHDPAKLLLFLCYCCRCSQYAPWVHATENGHVFVSNGKEEWHSCICCFVIFCVLASFGFVFSWYIWVWAAVFYAYFCLLIVCVLRQAEHVHCQLVVRTKHKDISQDHDIWPFLLMNNCVICLFSLSFGWIWGVRERG